MIPHPLALISPACRRIAWAALALGTALSAHAVEFEYSGFATLAAGRTFGSCVPDNAMSAKFNNNCTRYISDWSHAGVYTPSFSAKPESRLGLQGTARFNDQLSATTQMVARSLNGTQADLEWAYLSYKPTADWTLQLGRKRLPLFYFSDFQDVGYAYGWVRPPPDVYGWDVVNYNGANVSYQTSLGGWSLKGDLFAGGEKSKDNPYSTLLFNEPKEVSWRNIRGGAIEFSRAWFTGRAVMISNDFEQRDMNTGLLDVLSSGAEQGKQKIRGFSANIDADPWVARSEYSLFDRSEFQYKAKAYFASVGYRVGKFTPLILVSDYKESTPFPDNYDVLYMRTTSLALRYDLGQSSALKLQLDHYKDRSPGPLLGGSAKVITVGFDTVF